MSDFGIAFLAALVVSLVLHCYGGEVVISEEENQEIERQLTIINKPALKSFKTKYGDIIDCVDIYKQPAFDHPLLKNHTIQRKPRSAPTVAKEEAPSRAKSVTVSMSNVVCPYGSVPIRRTTKADIIRSKFSKPTASDSPPIVRPGTHYSILIVDKHDQEYFHGARAYITAYNPTVGEGQSSGAEIWIEGGPSTDLNSIQIGWVVDPEVYGDNRTRLFTYWIGNGATSHGCYDHRCPGFVQVDNRITLGVPFVHTSTIDGDQYALVAYVYQEQSTGHWWLILSKQNIAVGYWPKALFPFLEKGATDIVYGGRVQHNVYQLSPPMGSGRYADWSYNRACFFSHVQFVDHFYILTDPIKHTRTYHDTSGCYDIIDRGYDGKWGYVFSFGGPGGHCGN